MNPSRCAYECGRDAVATVGDGSTAVPVCVACGARARELTAAPVPSLTAFLRDAPPRPSLEEDDLVADVTAGESRRTAHAALCRRLRRHLHAGGPQRALQLAVDLSVSIVDLDDALRTLRRQGLAELVGYRWQLSADGELLEGAVNPAPPAAAPLAPTPVVAADGGRLPEEDDVTRRERLLRALANHPEGIAGADLAEALSRPADRVNTELGALARDGRCRRVGRGCYAPLLPVSAAPVDVAADSDGGEHRTAEGPDVGPRDVEPTVDAATGEGAAEASGDAPSAPASEASPTAGTDQEPDDFRRAYEAICGVAGERAQRIERLDAEQSRLHAELARRHARLLELEAAIDELTRAGKRLGDELAVAQSNLAASELTRERQEAVLDQVGQVLEWASGQRDEEDLAVDEPEALAVMEIAQRAGDPRPLEGSGVCRLCGCTDNAACEGGCAWVPNRLGVDVCSACVEALAQDAQDAQAFVEEVGEGEVVELHHGVDVDQLPDIVQLVDRVHAAGVAHQRLIDWLTARAPAGRLAEDSMLATARPWGDHLEAWSWHARLIAEALGHGRELARLADALADAS